MDLKLNNGVMIPQLGFGVFRAADGSETENAVRWALEAGYRHIDTAKIYGNESSVGQAIRASGIPRSEIFLTTKLWTEDVRAGRTRAAFEESLAQLGTDYVDLYLIHWPAEGFARAWAEMEALYKEGRIRAIGVSNFHRHHLEELAKTAEIKPAVDQIESHPYLTNQPLIDYCQGQGIDVEVWSPLGGSLGKADILHDETILALAQKYGKSAAQVALRWHLQRGVIVMPKSVHQERIAANFDIFDFALSEQDMAAISALNRDLRVGSHPDHFNF